MLRPGGLVTEGTAGSTGVSLAMLSPCFGVRAAVWMPDDAAEEKSAMVRVCGKERERERKRKKLASHVKTNPKFLNPCFF